MATNEFLSDLCATLGLDPSSHEDDILKATQLYVQNAVRAAADSFIEKPLSTEEEEKMSDESDRILGQIERKGLIPQVSYVTCLHPMHGAHNYNTMYKGIPVVIAPFFDDHGFYNGFAERCSVQLNNVISMANPREAIDYIEVRPGEAFIHYRKPHGSYVTMYPTTVIRIGSWLTV